MVKSVANTMFSQEAALSDSGSMLKMDHGGVVPNQSFGDLELRLKKGGSKMSLR